MTEWGVVSTMPLSTEEKIEWWMDRYFALQDDYAALLNRLAAIERAVQGDR